MASGLLGSAAPAATTWTTVYTVPAGKIATMNIRVVNRDYTNTASIRLAISAADGAALNKEYIECPDYPLKGGKVLEEIAIVAGPGEKVNFYSSTANCSIRVMGFERAQ